MTHPGVVLLPPPELHRVITAPEVWGLLSCPPQEPSESPREEDVSPGPTRTPTDAGEGPREEASGRPWWKRIFGP